MMRAFENRADTAVIDEPYYAAYLHDTGLDHPLRPAVLAGGPIDPARVVETLTGPIPGGRTIFYQKHMTHHMLPRFDRGWMRQCRNVFLIRAPEAVLASYLVKRADVALADIGFRQQAELFDTVAEYCGRAPSVIDAADVLADPPGALARLCAALQIPFDSAMLRWPPGGRPTDGAWAPAWYDAVERSTGFTSPNLAPITLPASLQPVADAARIYYEQMARFTL